MYANQVMFTLGPGKRSTAEKLVDQFAPAIGSRKGIKSATFLADETVGEYGALVLWESKEDAEAAFEALFPQLQKALAGIVQGQPVRRLFEVLEPKASPKR
ncbi:MAG: hypothetical protein GTN93_10590 [Anaerolineae bacterium]|nr:hypothetical protein [Anaerolineae bacterium]NIQ78521.1 hypothetical protein [Anaerolineae bacterium]